MLDFYNLYAEFHSPISDRDCGEKCSPYNDYGVPFCCDTRHSIPTAYHREWAYLESHTDLWHPWVGETQSETNQLMDQTPNGQMLIECLGYEHCQREFRSITCRAFPFFPYLSGKGEFLGLSPYLEYRDRCWIISHLDVVSPRYREEFMRAYRVIFQHDPEEKANFQAHADHARDTHRSSGTLIPLLHRSGEAYYVHPAHETLTPIKAGQFPVFGVYQIAAEMPFPDEEQEEKLT